MARRGSDDSETVPCPWLALTRYSDHGWIEKSCRLERYLLVQIRGLPWQMGIEGGKYERLARPVHPKNGRQWLSFTSASPTSSAGLRTKPTTTGSSPTPLEVAATIPFHRVAPRPTLQGHPNRV